MSNKSAGVFGTAILAGLAAWAAQGRAADEKTFRGEIADSQCALNVHSLSQSHKEMMEMKPEKIEALAPSPGSSSPPK